MEKCIFQIERIDFVEFTADSGERTLKVGECLFSNWGDNGFTENKRQMEDKLNEFSKRDLINLIIKLISDPREEY